MRMHQDAMCSWTETCSINTERSFAWKHFFKHSSSLPFFLPLLIQCDGCPCPLPHGSSKLCFHDLHVPVMGAVSIQKLVANSGNSWIHASQAPNLYLAIQFLIYTIIYFFRGIKERQSYTIEEDCALIKFVNENEYCYPVKGCKLYKRAEKAKVCHELLNCSAPTCNNFGRHAEWKIFGD